jgi:hypothetical protein
MRAVLAAHGLSVTLPDRWEGRLYLRDAVPDGSAHPAAYGWPEERANPVLHLANFALPPGRGDFGTGAVELMGEQHAFVSLFEYNAEEAGRPLFAARGRPRLTVRDFAGNQLQRTLPGQLGCQRFFTENSRPFCLYVVLGSKRHAVSLVQEVHEALAGVRVEEAQWQRL